MGIIWFQKAPKIHTKMGHTDQNVQKKSLKKWQKWQKMLILWANGLMDVPKHHNNKWPIYLGTKWYHINHFLVAYIVTAHNSFLV